MDALAPAAVSAEAAPNPVPAEAARRRTFAIIAHPDAGKTTLTEKLLLRGGAIQLAGAVRAKGNARRTRSDWMKIEQERGISVSTSVMTFEHGGLVFNLLDTPGHEDFSEDTYRTLTAVDAAVMVLDAAKGIESADPQAVRGLPAARHPDHHLRQQDGPRGARPLRTDRRDRADPGAGRRPGRLAGRPRRRIRRHLGHAGASDFLPVDADDAGASRSPASTTRGSTPWSAPSARRGAARGGRARRGRPASPSTCRPSARATLTPVFFGSALRDFGVGHLLDGLARYAPPPRPAAPATRATCEPGEDELTGFVFKVQANMDPNHRDRVAFLRLCSGKLTKGMRLKQVRTGKQVPVNAPLIFFAKDRQVAEEAWPGDVVGIANHGTLRIGDTLTEGEDAEFPRRALLRAGNPAACPAGRPDAGEEAEDGAGPAGRGRRGAAVPPARWLAARGRRGRPAAARCAAVPAQGGIRRPRRLPRHHVADDALGQPADPAADRAALDRFATANRRDAGEDHDGELVAFFGSDWRRKRAEEEWPVLRFHAVREQHGLEAAKR